MSKPPPPDSRTASDAEDKSTTTAPTNEQNDPAAPANDATFTAVLSPYRSLGPQGFFVLMLAIGAVCIGIGIVFRMIGAWPVLVFCGLDVALIYGAFKLNYRAARLHERVQLTPQALTIARVHPSGREESWTFNPYWVRLVLDEDPATERSELKLRSHGRELVIGRFLPEEERLEFARALLGALGRAERHPRGLRE